MSNIITTSQFTKQEILDYMNRADQLKNLDFFQFQNKTIILMFFEPSTRTFCSFQAAANKLGCKIICLTEKYSSIEKGESLEDTIKTLNVFGDVIVLRHPEKGAVQKATLASKVPIINAGDGAGEHPTQALLDLYTIFKELDTFGIDLNSENREIITVTFLGDIKHSRTIHSLIPLLHFFPKIKLIQVCPPNLEIPEIELSTMENVISITDVLYVTRIQKERFTNKIEYDLVSPITVNKKLLEKAKKKMIIMHPLPRLTEISTDIDSDPRAVYFKQIENGVYIRMAILEKILGR
jgi:aspartate carbamoyltransferase